MREISDEELFNIKETVFKHLPHEKGYMFILSTIVLIWLKNNREEEFAYTKTSNNQIKEKVEEISNFLYTGASLYKNTTSISVLLGEKSNIISNLSKLTNALNVSLRDFFIKDAELISSAMKLDEFGELSTFMEEIEKIKERVLNLDENELLFFLTNIMDMIYEGKSLNEDNYPRYDTVKLISGLLMIDKDFLNSNDINIHDPCIGEGGLAFMLKGVFHLGEINNVHISGYAREQVGYVISNLKNIIFDERLSKIKKGASYLNLFKEKEKLICSYPYRGSSWGDVEKSIKLRKDFLSFKNDLPSKNMESLVYIQDSLNTLHEKGKAIFMLASIGKFSNEKDKNVFMNIFKKQELEGVIVFPDYYNPSEENMLILIFKKGNKNIGIIDVYPEVSEENYIEDEGIYKAIQEYKIRQKEKILASREDVIKKILASSDYPPPKGRG